MIQQRFDEFGEEKEEDKGKEERGERKEGIAIVVLVLIGVGGGGGGEEWSNVQGDGEYTNVADEEGARRGEKGEWKKKKRKKKKEKKWTWTTKRTKATKLKRRTTVCAIPTRHAATATVRTTTTAIRSTERGGGWCPIASNRWC